jgi:hypothetical protein
MDIYENFIIGTFLYNLGLEVGLRATLREVSIAPVLCQQTPLDPTAGDVLIENPRVIRLIEFKRAAARDLTKEKAKLKVLRRMLEVLPDRFREVSREIHWYVESQSHDSEFETRIIPYLDLDLPRPAAMTKFIELPEFVRNIADRACELSGSEAATEDQRAYLKEAFNLGSVSTSSGALIVGVTAQGQVKYELVEDIREFLLPPERRHQLTFERARVHERARVREMGRNRREVVRELGLKREPDRGPEHEL